MPSASAILTKSASERACIFRINLSPMDLYRDLAEVQLTCNLLVHQTSRDKTHNLALASCKRRERFHEVAGPGVALPSRAIALYRARDRIQHVLIAKRLGE